MQIAYEAPSPELNHYTCPHCGALTIQNESPLYTREQSAGRTNYSRFESITLRTCYRCDDDCLWFGEWLVYPINGGIGTPVHPETPEHIQPDVDEARLIVAISPKSAAALLRLALEKICIHLHAEGKTLDEKIRWLVKTHRLDPLVQQTLDIVRVSGNDAVHPGQIDWRDNQSDVNALFGMMNEIVEELIARPARIRAKYELIPIEKREKAEEKDRKNMESSLEDERS